MDHCDVSLQGNWHCRPDGTIQRYLDQRQSPGEDVGMDVGLCYTENIFIIIHICIIYYSNSFSLYIFWLLIVNFHDIFQWNKQNSTSSLRVTDASTSELSLDDKLSISFTCKHIFWDIFTFQVSDSVGKLKDTNAEEIKTESKTESIVNTCRNVTCK